MKTVVFIPIHSIAETITNSSTELFICNMKKAPEQIRELLVSLNPSLLDSRLKIRLHNGPQELLSVILEFGDNIYPSTVVYILRQFIPMEVKLDLNLSGAGSYQEFAYLLRTWFQANEKMLSVFVKKFVVIEDEDNAIESNLFSEIEDRLNAIRLHFG